METIASGLSFTEGPVVFEDGSVIVCEVFGERITRIKKDGERQLIANVQGAPNGLALGSDGALYCCNNGGALETYTTGSIEHINLTTGRVERLYEACDNIPLAGPNDLIFDAAGGMWFTDCGKRFPNKELLGGLYYATADGRSIRRIVSGIALNGVGLSPDGNTVYAAATFQRWVMAYEANPELGSQAKGLLEGRIVGHYPGRRLLDSLAIEADGTIAQAICIENPGISRLNPEDGTEVSISFPDVLTTNIAFGGTDMRTAYVTLGKSGSVMRLPWPAPGLPLHFNG